MNFNVIINRLIRLARLDTSVFDEVRDDQVELVPALIVTAASAVLAGLGTFLYWSITSDVGDFVNGELINTLILGSAFLAVMWIVAGLVAYVVLAQLYRVQVDPQSILRTMGYAAFPLAGSVLMFLPVIGPVFALVPLAALLVIMIFAVQSASGAETNQVINASLVGFAVFVLVLGLIAGQSGAGDVPIGAGIFGILPSY